MAAGAGFHSSSTISDPHSGNPGAGDYRLNPGSTAAALEFKDVPIDPIGPAGVA